MKLTTILIFLAIFSVAAEGFSQGGTISLKMENASLKEVFQVLKSNSDYTFVYSEAMVEDVEIESLDLENASFENILNASLVETDLEYYLEGNVVVIRKKDPVFEQPLQQEKKTITGQVTDEDGNPFPGANIIVKGTTIGTVTDIEGNYTISVPIDKKILVYSFMGMKTQEINLKDQSVINIIMLDDSVGLDEIVAIGYGTKTKATVTGAVDMVGSERFEDRSQATIAQALQGVMPGLLITRSSGDIAATNGIQLRGITSRSGSGILIIIDGIPEPDNDASALSDLNPADVENITVLKDAQASIYGSRAAGGVILITTKNGTTREPVFKYSANFAINDPVTYAKKANLFDMAEYYWEAFENDGVSTHNYSYLKDILPGLDPEKTPWIKGPFSDTPKMSSSYYDWMDIMFDSALQQTHQLSVSGKGDKSNYYLSIGVLDADGTLAVAKNTYRKYDATLKYNMDVTDNLKVGANISLSKTKNERPSRFGQAVSQAQAVWSNHFPRTPKGNYYNFGGFTNPLAYAQSGQAETVGSRAVAKFNVVYEPIKDFKINGDYSTNIDHSLRNYVYKEIQHHDYDDTPTMRQHPNQAGSSIRRHEHQVVNLYGNYTKTIKDHKFDFMVGGSHEEYDLQRFNAGRKKILSEEVPILSLGDPELQITGASRSQWAIKSYFGRMNYAFKGKYLFEGTIRRDGSSRFAKDYRWGTFYGMSGAWLLSEESFMENLDWLDFLKIRTSYGELGNQNNVGLYDHINLINVDGLVLFGNPNNPTKNLTAHSSAVLASPTRSWETVAIKNVGFDYKLFENRLSGAFDYFIKDTRDMLVGKEFPEVLGIAPSTINGGELQTKGFELSINWNDELSNGFKYNVGFTLSDDQTEVTKLDDAVIPGYGLNKFVEGYAPYTYFHLKYDGFIKNEAELEEYKAIAGVPANLKVGDAKFMDLDGDGKIEYTQYKNGNDESGDLINSGSNTRRYQYGITLGAEWKGFDFGCFFQGIAKWNVMSGLNAPGSAWWVNPLESTLKDFYSEDNKDSFYPRASANGGIHGWNYQISDAPYKHRNADYIKLKTITLGYTLPKSISNKIGTNKVHVYFSGNDLWWSSHMPDGIDPERPYATGYLPIPKTYSFGIDVTLK